MFIAIRSGSGLACSLAAPEVLPKLCVATGASNLGQPDDRLGSLDLAEEGRRPSKLSLRQTRRQMGPRQCHAPKSIEVELQADF